MPPCRHYPLHCLSGLLWSELLWGSLSPPDGSVPSHLGIHPTPSPVDMGTQYVQDTNSQGLRPLKGLCQGSWWVREQDASWIFILRWNTKGALNMYIPIFCRNIRHSLKAHLCFWKKGNIRLTMKADWKACIRQKHKLIFEMRWNACWSDSLYKILHFGKTGRKVKINHLVVSQSIPSAASSFGQGKGSNSPLSFCCAHHLFWQPPYFTFRKQLFFLSPREGLYFYILSKYKQISSVMSVD